MVGAGAGVEGERAFGAGCREGKAFAAKLLRWWRWKLGNEGEAVITKPARVTKATSPIEFIELVTPTRDGSGLVLRVGRAEIEVARGFDGRFTTPALRRQRFYAVVARTDAPTYPHRVPNQNWREVVPQLAALHRGGQLVPFIGLGMSRPRCSNWQGFVQRLCTAAAVPSGSPAGGSAPATDEASLLRLADDAMRTLRSWPHERRRPAIAQALFDVTTTNLPPQASALAEFRWPLVISTNYEDLFWHAAREKSWNNEPFEILGRSLRDSQVVLRSLDWPSRPILWAIQGFLGGPYADVSESVPAVAQRDALLNQLVVGHRQYQEAAHLNPHFRRAFAEVFRRRALLFLGSGIAENYLANLFAEVLVTQGQRAGSHYALLPSWEVDDDKLRFLSDRLGVLAYTYDDYRDVEELLARLLSNTKHFMPAKYKTGEACPDTVVDVCQIVYRIQQPAGATLELVLDHRSIVDDATRQGCIWAVSVGRSVASDRHHLFHGSMSKGVLEALGLSAAGFSAEPVSEFLFPHSDRRELVAVAARPTRPLVGPSAPHTGHSAHAGPTDADSAPLPDSRTLDAIRRATDALLRFAASEPGIDAVRVGLLSAGPSAPWHPIFACVIMLGAIRDAARNLASNLRVELTVVDSRVWTRVLSGGLPVHEILSAARLPVLVQVDAADGDIADSLVHMAEPGSTLRDLLHALRLQEGDWNWSVTPVQSSRAESNERPEDIALVPFSTITLHPSLERLDEP